MEEGSGSVADLRPRQLAGVVQQPGPSGLALPEGEKDRGDRDGKPGPHGPLRWTQEMEQGQRRGDSGGPTERIAENHRSAVLCAVRSDQVLPALEAGFVELVPLPEQGALQTGRADEP